MVLETAAKTAASESGRISASGDRWGETRRWPPCTIGDALTIAPRMATMPRLAQTLTILLPALVSAAQPHAQNASSGPLA